MKVYPEKEFRNLLPSNLNILISFMKKTSTGQAISYLLIGKPGLDVLFPSYKH